MTVCMHAHQYRHPADLQTATDSPEKSERRRSAVTPSDGGRRRANAARRRKAPAMAPIGRRCAGIIFLLKIAAIGLALRTHRRVASRRRELLASL